MFRSNRSVLMAPTDGDAPSGATIQPSTAPTGASSAPLGAVPAAPITVPTVQTEGASPAAPMTSSAPDAPKPEAKPDASKPEAKNRTVHTMTDRQVGDLKRRAAEQAKAKEAERLGFKSVAEMEKFIEQARRRNERKSAAPRPSTVTEKAEAIEAEAGSTSIPHPDAQPEGKAGDLARRLAKAESEVRRLKREIASERTRTKVLVAAAKAGIEDVDYATHLMNSHLTSLPEEKLSDFDPDDFFKSLRASKPFLFGERSAVGSTAPGGESPALPPAPSAPSRAPQAKPAEMIRQQSEQQKRDAMNLSPEDWDKFKRERGWSGGVVTVPRTLPT